MKFLSLGALWSASAIALTLTGAASAATLNVPSVSYPTIQAAVDAAAGGDTVLLADGTYTGPGNVDIDFNGRNLTVTSQNGPSAAIIDCGGSTGANHRGFYLHSSETGAVISGLTIKNGYETNDFGGALSLFTYGVTVQNCVIANSTSRNGGGLYTNNSLGTATISGCTFSGNTTNGSGGGLYVNSTSTGTAIVSGCRFLNNSSTGSGGGGAYVSESGSGAISVSGCGFSANQAPNNGGGGIFNSNIGTSGTITLAGSTFSGNSASASLGGGGIFNSNGGTGSGTIAVVNCVLSGNSAGGGGGIFNSNQSGGPVSVTNCTLSGNTGGTALGGGGGIGNYNFGTVTLTNTIIYGDTGGEIGNYAPTNPSGTTIPASVTFCDVQGNYPGIGNISLNPQFVSALSNLHLTFGSPCLGAGTATGAPAADKDGTLRPSPPSIGAYELPAPGTTHLLWNNTSGTTSIWNYSIASGSFSHVEYGPYAGYTAQAIADGGTDGKTRVLWNNTNGTTSIWSLNNTTGIYTHAEFGPYAGYKATAISVASDNTTHILWDNTSGQMSLWNYSTTDGSFTHREYGPYAGYTASGIADGSDGKEQILWDKTDGATSIWSLNNTSGIYAHAEYGPYAGYTAVALSNGS